MKKLKIKNNKLNILLVIIGRLVLYVLGYILAECFLYWGFCQNTIY